MKPIALNEYLAKLVKPPVARPTTLLNLYSGSGSEIIGALRAGWSEVLGIERDLDEHGGVAGYIEIAEHRIEAWKKDAHIRAAEARVKEAA